MNASIKIILKKGKTYKNGKNPILLRIIYKQNMKTFSTGLTSTLEEWDSSKGRFKGDVKNSKATNKALDAIEEKAEMIKIKFILENTTFSIERFTELFLESDADRKERETEGKERVSKIKEGKKVLLYDLFDSMISAMKAEKRATSSNTYSACLSKIKKYKKNKNVKVIDVTPEFLKEFETYLLNNNVTKGNAYHTMKIFRGAMNEARRRGIITGSNYPFKESWNSCYSPAHLNHKERRVLTLEEQEELDKTDLLL